MLQDIAPYKLDNHYYPDRSAEADSVVLCFRGMGAGKEILMDAEAPGSVAGEKGGFPTYSSFAGIKNDALTYLFAIGQERYFLLQYEEIEGKELPDGCSFKNVKDIRKEGTLARRLVFALYTAYHLSEWYESSRFCGKCGSATVNDDKERARVCPACKNMIYPRINPAVIIGVTDKDSNRLILTKYRTGFAQNALVAGFTEIGETLEETVKREVMEEVGLEVDNIRYYKSQPWGVALDILSGFYCDVVGDKEISMDESELKYAKWVAPEDIILQSPDYSLTNEMMRVFKEKGYEGTV